MSGNNQTTKSLVAYELIRDAIVSGAKFPGTRLVIADLESEYSLGRGAIREALMRLDRSGLVQNIPFKGMVVAPPPKLAEIEHLYSMRCELEMLLTLEAMKNLNAESFAVLDNLLEKFRDLTCLEGTFFSLDRQFHSFIYRASGMHHLCSLVDKIMDTIEVFLNLYHYEDTDQTVFVNEHIEIVRALKAKDVESLVPTLQSNIRGGLRLVDRAYSKIVVKDRTSNAPR